MTSQYCHVLSKAEEKSKFGGKAVNLALAQRLGYKVPRTIVIDRRALALFLAENKLEEQLKSYLENIDESSFQSIVSAVKCANIPSELRLEIQLAAEDLLKKAPYGLAIRSSAIFEDSEKASFAGVFDSFLGIKKLEEVLEKVIACWCSNWSPRALRYMKRMGIEPMIDSMAVMIQEVIPAKKSGVIYTADPKTGNPWHFALQATRGLSLDLMSGSGGGDSFLLDWDTGKVQEQILLPQNFVLKATTEGLRQVSNPSNDLAEAALSGEEAAKIAGIARELDQHFETRLDIEWTISSQDFYIVQVRPLTALPEYFPFDLTKEQSKRSWKPALATLPLRSDQIPNRLTPLYSHYSEAEMWHRYQPEDIIFTSICQYELDANGYRYWETDEQPNFQSYFQNPGEYEAWIRQNEPAYRLRWDKHGEELAVIKTIAKEGVTNTMTATELIPVVLQVMDQLWDLNAFGWSGPQALGWMCEAALAHFLKENNVETEIAALLSGGKTSYTFRMTKAQQNLGWSIREFSVKKAFEELPIVELVPHLLKNEPESDFMLQLEAFCWEFGKIPPSWINRPPFWSNGAADIQIINAIKNAWLGKSRDVVEILNENLKQREKQVQKICQKLRGNELTRFNYLLEWARYWGQALNDRHGLTIGLLQERELLWQLGNRLQQEGLLEQAEDILVLKQTDLETIMRTGNPLMVKKNYENQRYAFRRNWRLKPAPILGLIQGVRKQNIPRRPEAKTNDDVFKGRGFGGGQATGKAKNIVNLLDPKVLESLEQHDVLILPHERAFHYADWHSILTIVRAVVSPGRPSHHLAQVARECGVPLVGEITEDLSAIVQGAIIHVDGTNGIVHL